MPIVDHSALVPYSPEQMFCLVNDVDAYQDFVPWCLDSQVIERSDTQLTGRLCIGQTGVKKTFTTENTLHPHERIDLRLIEGPFKSFSGHWCFDALGDAGCKLSLHLTFEFSSSMLERAFAVVFNKVSNALVNAFCARAGAVYGSG